MSTKMSARDRFKAANFVGLDNNSSQNLTNSIIDNLESEKKDPKPEVIEELVVKAASTKKNKVMGRPRKFPKGKKTVTLGIKVLDEENRFLEEYGWKYGGKTGYVTHLIRKEMERVQR